MDLLACMECEQRFYLPGTGSSDRRFCPHCGGGLSLALHGMTSIPLDAHWLDPRVGAADPPEVTVVELRRKRERGRRIYKRIVMGLSDYFSVQDIGGSVQVSVNRGAPADAALRLAAVLDGVDANWEEHFYLPTSDSTAPPGDLGTLPASSGNHLRLVASTVNDGQPEQRA